jgi:uncharacterized protein
VPRGARRLGAAAITPVAGLLEAVNLIEPDMQVVETAAALRPSALRTLDTLHLASAFSLEQYLGAFVTYDERLQAAAGDAGLAVLAPA